MGRSGDEFTITTLRLNFTKVIQKLKAHYGEPAPPKTTDPFELIILENIAYLVDDGRREKAFDLLRDTVGLRPIDILNATNEQLDQATKVGGVSPQLRSTRLKECALIALNEFGGDLRMVLKPPFAKAIKALKQFPGFGEPGAEKILLFTKTHPVLALDSNGLRVLLRLGFGSEKKNYSASYKSAREAIADQLGDNCDELIETHQLLRQHGKTICKTNKPRCDQCPVSTVCNFYLGQ
jgi:endonuclease-3